MVSVWRHHESRSYFQKIPPLFGTQAFTVMFTRASNKVITMTKYSNITEHMLPRQNHELHQSECLSSSKFSNVESWVLALAVTTNIVTVNASTCSCPSSPMFCRIQPDVDVQLGWAPLLTARPFPNSKSNPTRPSYQLAPFRQAPSTDAPIPTYTTFSFLIFCLFCFVTTAREQTAGM
jgi:hypothetical protein